MSYGDAVRYLDKQKLYISNHQPIVGPQGVNWDDWDSSDHYYKGAWILHTLRHAIGDDEKWFAIFKGFYQKYAFSLITTADFVQYVNEQTGQDWQPFFDQYLYHPDLPTLQYRIETKGDNIELSYRWSADVAGFAMPVRIGGANKWMTVTPVVNKWQKTLLFNTKTNDFRVADDLFLIKTEQL
jgi:aminopeptidase N